MKAQNEQKKTGLFIYGMISFFILVFYSFCIIFAKNGMPSFVAFIICLVCCIMIFCYFSLFSIIEDYTKEIAMLKMEMTFTKRMERMNVRAAYRACQNGLPEEELGELVNRLTGTNEELDLKL